MLNITSLVLTYLTVKSLYLLTTFIWFHPLPTQGSKMLWSGQKMGITRLLRESAGESLCWFLTHSELVLGTCFCTEKNLYFHCFFLHPGISIHFWLGALNICCNKLLSLFFFFLNPFGTWYSGWSFLWAQRTAESEIKNYSLLFLFLWGLLNEE